MLRHFATPERADPPPASAPVRGRAVEAIPTTPMRWLWASLLSVIHELDPLFRHPQPRLLVQRADRLHRLSEAFLCFSATALSLVCDRDYFQVYKLKVLDRERGNRKKAYH